MIHIDADQGEGGGQVLRAVLALSAVQGESVHLQAIRARRKVPGLQAQHLTAVTALAQICGAEVRGAELGSRELTFVPGPVRPGEYHFEIGTAGSTMLVLQALLLPLALAGRPSRVLLSGGTHVPWSPPADYLQEILLPCLEQIGIRARLDVARWGFYPRGGGRVAMEVTGSAVLSPLTLVRRLDGLTIRGISATAGLAPEIAERQRTLAVERLRAAGQSAAIEARQVRAFSRGSFVFLAAHGDGGSGGFSGLGAREAEVEQIVDAAVDGLLEFARTDAGCDLHLADQLVVPLALAPGTSRLTTSRVTPHLLTAVSLVQQFLGCPVQVRGEVGSAGSVTIEGIGLHTPKSSGAVGAAPREQGGGTHASSAERPMQPAVVRKARAADGLSIQRLLAHFAARGEVLHRTLDEVYEHLRDFVVGEADGQIVGVCALWLYWEDLAEIRSLAVHEAHAGRGLGTALVDACVDEAAHLGIRRVFALTYRPGFFERLGFRTLDKRELPQKIWKDCIRCARFSCCDEVALIRDVEPARAA